MSILADKTELAALKMLARSLKYFGSLAYLQMTEADAFAARAAENHGKAIIETNGYRLIDQPRKRRIIQKIKP